MPSDSLWRIDTIPPHLREYFEPIAGKDGRNPHPTVKPLSLLIWMCKLLAPPPEYAPRRLLVPFAGSGSEVVAAALSGCFEEIVGIEQSAEYCDIARARCRWWQGWSERTGETEPKAILKAHKKAAKDGNGKATEAEVRQLELEAVS